MKGYLLLETGDWFEGELIGSKKESAGEIVFQTGMTGYQEVLTDPSYAGQIVNFTYPLIGNYGMNHLDNQSIRPSVSGIIASELCAEPSHRQYIMTFEHMLKKHDITGIMGIDTREITKIIRKHGTVQGKIVREIKADQQISSFTVRELNRNVPIVKRVATTEPIYYPGTGAHVVVIDYGSKYSIIDALTSLGCAVTIVPYTYTRKEIMSLEPDGIILSNGPGDPKELVPNLGEIKNVVIHYPTLGICLGHQLLGLTFGGDTEKLSFGHRGVNHPVINLQTNKVWITSQNHGYTVKEESLKQTDFQVTYRNINDHSIEGMRHSYLPIQSVQFHPEAHPGPSEAFGIFTEFVQQCNGLKGAKKYA